MASTGNIAGIILCGGRSRRMGGGTKPLLPLGSKPMLAHIVARVAPQVAVLAINANGDPSPYTFTSLPVIPDGLADFPGPLAGILAGIHWANTLPGCDSLLSVAGDTPFFPPDLVQRLSEAAPQADRIAVAVSAGRRHPVFALWPLSLREDLERFLKSGIGKVAAFIDSHPAVDVEFPAFMTKSGRAVDPFFNVNTLAELDTAHRILEAIAA
jgi:molybdopterin-guanine dinucleotide biosynthesis protein A